MAQTLFDEGKRLTAQGDCAHALPKFEASQKLDRSIGALMNVANCNELLGRTATAWARFVETESLARQRADHERELYAHDRAAKLFPKLSRLTITSRSMEPNVVIHRDDVTVDVAALGLAIPIDPGGHVVEASSGGVVVFRTVVTAKGIGELLSVVVPPRDDEEVSGFAHRDPGSARRSLTIVTAGVAVGCLTLGTIFGVAARARWHAAEATCGATGCPESGQSLATDARRFATASTIFFVTSGVSAATSTILYLTLPSNSVRLSPTIGRSLGLSIDATF